MFFCMLVVFVELFKLVIDLKDLEIVWWVFVFLEMGKIEVVVVLIYVLCYIDVVKIIGFSEEVVWVILFCVMN